MGLVSDVFAERRARQLRGHDGDRPHPLQHGRAPASSTTPSRCWCASAAAPRRSRTTATSSTPPKLRRELVDAGRHLLLHDGLGGHRPPHRPLRARPTRRTRSARRWPGWKAPTRLVVTVGHTLYAVRGSARLPAAGPGQGRRRARSSRRRRCALDIVGARVDARGGAGRDRRASTAAAIDVPRAAARRPRRPTASSSTCTSRAPTARLRRERGPLRRALGRQLAREHPAPGADCVFSVPDSSNSAALGFSEESGIPLELALIRNHYVGRTFIQPAQAGRDAKVKVKYNPVREVLAGKQRRDGGRFHRARHHQPRPGRDDPPRRGARGAFPGRLRRRSSGRATTASTRRNREELIARRIRSRRSARISASIPSATCRSMACSAPAPGSPAASATPVSPAPIRRPCPLRPAKLRLETAGVNVRHTTVCHESLRLFLRCGPRGRHALR